MAVQVLVTKSMSPRPESASAMATKKASPGRSAAKAPMAPHRAINSDFVPCMTLDWLLISSSDGLQELALVA